MKMKSIMKIIALFLSTVMLCIFIVPISAVDNDQVDATPRWTSIATMDIGIVFYENEGIAAASAIKHATASHIVGALYLYKWNGTNYEYIDDVWGSKTVGTLSLSIDFVAEPGVQYKAVFTVVAYTDGVGEDETIVYYRTCQ